MRLVLLIDRTLAGDRAAEVGYSRPDSGQKADKPRVFIVAGGDDTHGELRSFFGDGYDVRVADDSPLSFRSLEDDPPDVAIVPDLSVLERVRAERLGSGLPVLVLSNGTEVDSHLPDAGIETDFLERPFGRTELLASVDRLLRLARSTRALRYEAYSDPLTGLPNRRAMDQRLTEEVTRAARYHTPLACVVADLDELKPLNDKFGHSVGDQALKILAKVLRAQLRETDFAARIGGDEFLMLLPHTEPKDAKILAERIIGELSAVRLIQGRETPKVAASFGVSALKEGWVATSMIEAADRALYEAKNSGRGRVAQAPD